MIKRPKIWKSLTQLAMAGTASMVLLGACQAMQGEGEGGEGEGGEGMRASGAASANTLLMDHPGEGDEGAAMGLNSASGEGAGEGEGGTSKAVNPATDDVAYLTELSLVRGHLLVGFELYKQDAYELAEAHMKHPHDELIKGIEPALKARKASSFEKELVVLTNAVKNRVPLADVTAAYEAVNVAIGKAERAGTSKALSDPRKVVTIVEQLVRIAASEYAMGVVDGKVVMPKEYQDSFGFTQVAKQWLASLDAVSAADSDARAKIHAQLDGLAPAWPNIVPPATIEADASLLYGAAARIQIAGLSI